MYGVQHMKPININNWEISGERGGESGYSIQYTGFTRCSWTSNGLTSHLVTPQGNLRGKLHTPLVLLDLTRHSANKMPIDWPRKELWRGLRRVGRTPPVANPGDNYLLTNPRSWILLDSALKISWYKLHAGLTQPTRCLCSLSPTLYLGDHNRA